MVEVLKCGGMLLGKAGQYGNVLKIRPPLVFDHDDAAAFLDVFTAAVANAHS
jgi:4-aminobutyrate aminotransferase-like enzyme